MHKKPLVAVFVLGLLLLTVATAWGRPAPITKDGVLPIAKGTPTPNLQLIPLGTNTVVNAQAGTPLALPGTFCTGDWMGSRRYSYNGTFSGGDIFYTFQDPSLTHPYSWNPAGCTPAYTFNVSALNFEISKRPTSTSPNPFTFGFQPIVFDADMTNPSCPFPGAVKCAGPVYAVTLTGNATTSLTYKVNLPFTIECCVTGPYFAGWANIGTWTSAPTIAGPVVDDATSSIPPPPTALPCYGYIYGDGPPLGIYSWVADWLGVSRNLRMWSEGYTPTDVGTQCTPGICDWQYWMAGSPAKWGRMNFDSATSAYTLPNASGSRSKMGVRFISDGLDTLKEVAFAGWTYVGAPDITVEVWGPGPAQGGTTCWTTEPLTLLYSVTIPNASVVDYPLLNTVPIPNITWGHLNGGPNEDLYVTIHTQGLPNRFALLYRTIDAGLCGADPHSVAKVGSNWWYLADYYGDHDEFYLDAFVCKEKVPIVEVNCSTPGPDDWNTWAHDYQRTSASNINLGDPCKVREQWRAYLPSISSFNSPVIAGNRIYVSSDGEVNSYDLATGAPGNKVNAFPWTGGQVRSNVTVEGNRVFVTGGTGTSISCWDATLTTPFWSNDLTGAGLTTTGNGPLATRNRFGAAAVYAVGLDSIVVIATEMPSASTHGWVYAMDVKTGFLYAGWAINPVPLDRGVYYSPSYDGTNLYFGTYKYPSNTDGSLYSINAATGAVNWNFKDALYPDEAWTSGVSVEGKNIYAATFLYDAVNSVYGGHRYSIDKSGVAPVVNWRGSNGPDLYGTPTIGRNFLYIPQDDPSAGVMMVDKVLGKVVYNWQADGVGAVPMTVTLTCDKYVFAGTRAPGNKGYWYLLNAADQTVKWRREFTGIVNGTSIARDMVTGDDYAVVNARSATSEPSGFGVVTAWRFNQTTRPFARQNVYETPIILVPLNSGDGLAASEAGVYSNTGCVDLNITATNVYDPAPAAKMSSNLQRQYAAAVADLKTGADYLTYWEGGSVTKAAKMAGIGQMVDGDLTGYDKAADDVRASMKNRSTRPTAAGANDIVRTHAASVVYSTNPIPTGGSTNISWLFDGTNLGRGVDDEQIESVMNDPDFYPEDLGYAVKGYPKLLIHYVGGCPNATSVINWNQQGATNTEKVYNFGTLGGMKTNADQALKWGADPTGSNAWLYDGGLFLCGDSSAGIGGALVRIGTYSNNARNFMPDPRASDAKCGFDGSAQAVHLGWIRTQGCPGTAVEVMGSWIKSYYSDSLEAVASTSPLACMGLAIAQTEIGADDPTYGGFKLLRWDFKNRDAVAKPAIYAGTFMDWDVGPNGSNNVGYIRDDYNGYYQRLADAGATQYAYGMLDPEMPSAYCGIDAAAAPAYRIESISNALRVYNTSAPPGEWTMPPPTGHGRVWHSIVTATPTRGTDHGVTPEDRSGILVNQPFSLAPNGTAAITQALYAVPAASQDDNLIGAEGYAVAARAARWAGFARGDVNDDGCINLADVCWLLSGNQIYPDTYCGDVNNDGVVNAADQLRLLNYISGIPGNTPQGAWRFTF